MTTEQRQTKRLEILSKICTLSSFDAGKDIAFEKIERELPDIEPNFINSQLLYLKQEGYITGLTVPDFDGEDIITVKLSSKGIKLIEQIETRQKINDAYKEHFSEKSINIFLSDVSHSPIFVQSPNSQVTNTNIKNSEVFSKLKANIEQEISDEKIKRILIDKLSEMQGALNSPNYAILYKEFIQSAANYMTIISPFVPQLTEFIKNSFS